MAQESPQTSTRPLLLLVDGHSLAFRSYYALTKGGDGGLSTEAGIPTSVTHGFLKALLENCRGLEPQGVVVAFDTAEPTFRHQEDANYKAHREEAPEAFFIDLANLQRVLVEGLDLPLCLAPGYEADDVLGTLAHRAAQEGWRVRILSGDRDLFQLVDDARDIAVLYMGGGPYARSSGPTVVRREQVLERLGVIPEEVVDLKALTGDSSDNIPGVKGVGPKTAVTLLKENGDLDGIYAALDALDGPKASKGAIKGALRGKLEAGRADAFLSRRLARILVDVPLPEPPRLHLGEVRRDAFGALLEEFELHSLKRQVEGFVRIFSAHPDPDATAQSSGAASAAPAETASPAGAAAKGTRKSQAAKPSPGVDAEGTSAAATGDAGADAGDGAAASAAPRLNPALIRTPEALQALVRQLEQHTDPAAPVALDTETTDLNPFKAELVGIGVCWGPEPNDLAYVPVDHGGTDGLGVEPVLAALAPWLASDSHPKTLQNAKYDRLVLLRHGIALGGVVMDTLLADYLRDANAKH
ncbi:MAG: 5'-3' exonuclease H3TH domain-containing protein, partial [Cyanobacteriota bacterium]|nr:5'-3' exonuclease H3TH domain-containing protein [Cyanobacteriota bacterium]